jgi:hypothetical protein
VKYGCLVDDTNNNMKVNSERQLCLKVLTKVNEAGVVVGKKVGRSGTSGCGGRVRVKGILYSGGELVPEWPGLVDDRRRRLDARFNNE